MAWEDLIGQNLAGYYVFPWLGGSRIHRKGRTWRVVGRRPREFGWYLFELTGGRTAKLCEPANAPPDYADDRVTARGYLVGDRFIPEKARVDPDPEKLVEQTVPVYLAERGLDRFVPVQVALDEENRAIYTMQLFETGAEAAAREAFITRVPTLAGVKDVSPALDLAFRFASRQRELAEQRRAEEERRRAEEERLEQIRRNMGTAVGRRVLAATDFTAAARAALLVGGAQLIDARPAYGRDEMVVQYRFEHRRLECTCDRNTLRIIDSGICLTDYRTGEKGDTRFTLETLPGVVRQALREGRLVVYRHADGDQPDDGEWDD